MPELSFLPARDSKIQGAPEFARILNYGNTTSLRHIVLYNGGGKTTWERTIVDFDISALPEGKLIAAKLVRDISSLSSAAAPAAKLSRCTRPNERRAGWRRFGSIPTWSISPA